MKRIPSLTLAFMLTFALSQQASETVLEVVSANDDLSTLAAALETAGLSETLSGEGPFTLFAPTNDAFKALPAGELDRLLADPEALAVVLSYHVVEGRVLSDEVAQFADDSADQQPLVTLQGGTLELAPRENTDEPLFVNDRATLVEADVPAANAALHLIDAVLLPGEVGAGGAVTGGGMTGGSPTGR